MLQKAIAATHPDDKHGSLFLELTKKIPDLRTLNTLHSEKLLGKNFGVIESAAGSGSRMEQHCTGNGGQVTTSSRLVLPPQPQPDSQSDNSPDRWSSSSSSSLIMGHFSPNSTDDNRRSVSPSHHDWNDSKDGGCYGSPMSSSSGVSSDDSLSRKGSISLTSVPAKMAYINSYTTLVMDPTEDNNLYTSNNNSSTTTSTTGNVHVHGHILNNHHYVNSKMNRVDSPTDSGIESGKEHGSSNTPTTSVCSSPQSAIEDKLVINVKDANTAANTDNDKVESIDDMPVLKRALQAPPLVNTNKLMDEAYRHHKKFRAARRDTEPHSPSTTTGRIQETAQSTAANTTASGATVVVTASAISSPCPPPPSPQSSTLASSHSTLLKTLEQPSRYLNEQQLKRTDLIHNIIMNTEAANGPSVVKETVPAATSANTLYSQYQHVQPNTEQQHSVYVSPVTSATTIPKDNIAVMYPHGYYHMPVATPTATTAAAAAAGCPFSAGRINSPPAHHHPHHAHNPHTQYMSLYHHNTVQRTSPSPSYLDTISQHQQQAQHSAPSPTSVLVIGSTPVSGSLSSPSRPIHAQSPYSHLQRCLTATTAPPTVQTTIGQITAQTVSDGGVPLMGADVDVQPLNLSKKSSAPPSPAPQATTPNNAMSTPTNTTQSTNNTTATSSVVTATSVNTFSTPNTPATIKMELD